MIATNFKLVFILNAVIALFLVGCKSSQVSRIETERPSFFESEIQSRSWVDPDGTPVRFLSENTTNVISRGEFLIAYFGDSASNQARCIEIYKVIRKDADGLYDKYVLLDHDWGPRDSAWWRGRVVSVELIVVNGMVVFKIVRDLMLEKEDGKKRILYYLNYRPGYGIRPNISEWWLAVPNDQGRNVISQP